MKTVIQEMMKAYNPRNIYEKKHAIKEIMQEIILYGLSQAGFFKEASFYGGTALRIFYGLDRFSEDLDFSLFVSNKDFSLAPYLPNIKKEAQAFGLKVDIMVKEKKVASSIKSAFLKGDTIENFILFYPDERIQGINKEEKIKVKFEIDINPPEFATYERKYQLLPAPYEVVLYDEASLFAGKIHAVLCRAWQDRVKGRDLYDYVFYLSNKIPVNLDHLKARLMQSGHIEKDTSYTLDDLKKMLSEKFAEIDYKEARKDVEPFISDDKKLAVWNKDFFIQITQQLQAK